MCHLVEDVDAAPVLANAQVTRGLPHVVVVREEDRVGADSVGDAHDGGRLLLGAGNGHTVGATLAGPARLEVDDALAGADLVQDSKLGLGELAGLLGGGVRVEEGVHVGAHPVDRAAQRGAVLLPDVDGLGRGDLAVVAGGRELRAARVHEARQGAGGAVAVEDGLVTDDDHADQVPLGPVDNVLDLGLGAGDAAAVDEDTNDHLQTVLPAGLADILEGVALGGVDTDVGETVLGDLGHVGVHGSLGLAATVGGEGSVGHTHAVALGLGAGSRLAGGCVLRGVGCLRRSLSRGLRRARGRGGSSRGRLRSARGLVAVGERADVGVVSAGDGHGLLGLGVGSRCDGLRSRVDHAGAGGNHSGRGVDGVGTRARADVGRGLNSAGDSRSRGLDGGNGAGHGGRGLHDGRDTTVSVGAAGNLGGGGTADGGGVSDGQGGRGDGVDTGGREAGHTGGGQRRRRSGRGRRSARGSLAGGGLAGGSRSAGRRSLAGSRLTGRRSDLDSDGGVAGGALGGGLLGGHRGGSLRGRLRADGSDAGRRGRDPGRRAVEGDDLGGAAAGLLGGGSGRSDGGRLLGAVIAIIDRDAAGAGHGTAGHLVPALMESIVTTSVRHIGQSGPQEGGRGGQESTLHGEAVVNTNEVVNIKSRVEKEAAERVKRGVVVRNVGVKEGRLEDGERERRRRRGREKRTGRVEEVEKGR